MNIAVIGASAGIGMEIIKRAVAREHTVTTLSRSKLLLVNSKSVHSIQGNALNKYLLKKSIEKADAVMGTLGADKNIKSTTLFSDFAKVVVDLQREIKTKVPFIFVTGFGTGDSQEYATWFLKMFLKYTLKDVYLDKAKMEEIIRSSDLNWIFVRPGLLLDEPVTEKYRTESTLFSGINIGGINRSDVADFMVKQAEHPSEMKKFVGITAK